MVLYFPPFESMCALLRSFVQNPADAHDIFARDQTVRRNLLYVLGITVLVGVLNWLFRNTPAVPTGAHSVVALLVYPLMWGPAFFAVHTQERRLTEYGLGVNVKVFVGAAITAIFLLVWPWSNYSVAKSLLEAYARTS